MLLLDWLLRLLPVSEVCGPPVLSGAVCVAMAFDVAVELFSACCLTNWN